MDGCRVKRLASKITHQVKFNAPHENNCKQRDKLDKMTCYTIGGRQVRCESPAPGIRIEILANIDFFTSEKITFILSK